MRDLIEAKNTSLFLKEHGISAKKRYGQNFLTDRHVLNKIISGSEISKEDIVLEIGPGIGTMTQALCEAAGSVIAVEIDRDMIPLLTENLSEFDNYEIINEDVLKLDLKKVLAEHIDKESCADVPANENDVMTLKKRVKVAANLPYYITTPILMQLLESRLPIASITVMVQKEVADRIKAKPGGKDYGALSLAVQYYAEAEVIANVPPNCFIPRPGVDSAVVRLKCYDHPPVSAESETRLFAVIRAAFAQRRKTLANALKNSPELSVSREQVEEALSEMGLVTDIRGERLSLEEFARLADIIGS